MLDAIIANAPTLALLVAKIALLLLTCHALLCLIESIHAVGQLARRRRDAIEQLAVKRISGPVRRPPTLR